MPKLVVPSLTLLYLNGLELSLPFVDFLCWPSLQKCSTSTLLNLRNSSYNSSNVVGHSLTRLLWSWPACNALIACVIACASKTSRACALSRRNLRKKSGNVSLSYYWQEKKIFFCTDICLETLEVNKEFILELCPRCDRSR
jgi:hypothetical protein